VDCSALPRCRSFSALYELMYNYTNLKRGSRRITILIYQMDIHNEFTEWAIARGVKLNGIAIHKFPCRGLGILAEKQFKVCRTNFYVVLIWLHFCGILDHIIQNRFPDIVSNFVSCFSLLNSPFEANNLRFSPKISSAKSFTGAFWAVIFIRIICCNYCLLHTTLSIELLLTLNQAGDTLLTVPISALRTVQTVPKSISKHIGTITVQGLLAAELSMDASEVRAPWRAVLPTKDDFAEYMPLMWHSSLQSLLPPASLLLLENQEKKISQDWTMVSAAFPALSYRHYVHNWLIVSTRTFYYTSSKIKTKKPIKYDDCIALSPFADCFNHADVGCKVTFSPSGYEISADREIEKGQEIHISYGNHSNDFLLTEYGFILKENRWDEICLDEFVLPLFSEEQKQQLQEAGFLGKFVLDRETICYRTQVALRLLCMPVNRWQRLVAKGVETEDKYKISVDGTLLKALKLHLNSVDEKLKQVKVLACGLDSQKDILGRRWKQIRLLLTACISRMET
jgi:hypothetical protein